MSCLQKSINTLLLWAYRYKYTSKELGVITDILNISVPVKSWRSIVLWPGFRIRVRIQWAA
jgi:hypothetical protein